MCELTLGYLVRYISYEKPGFSYFSFKLCIISVLMMQSERKDFNMCDYRSTSVIISQSTDINDRPTYAGIQ